MFANSYLHDDMVAEDIASEVLMKLWNYLKQHPTDKFEGLLLTMLKNTSLNYLKHLAVVKKSNSDILQSYNSELNLRISMLESFDPSQISSKEILKLYKEAMTVLSPKTREIFVESRFDGLSNKEIAERHNLSVKSIEYHISKALKVLREHLKDYLPLIVFLYPNLY